MERIRLGNTGLNVSKFILGGHEYLADGRSRGFNEDMKLAVSPGYVGTGYGGPKRIEVLKAAWDLGINILDVTINSEKEALGRNLKECPPPHEVYIQTRPEGMCYGYDRNNARLLDLPGLRAEVQRCLGLLGREVIDIFNIGLLAWSINSRPDYIAVLAHNLSELKREGLIRFCNANSFSGARLHLAMIESGAFEIVNLDLNYGEPFSLDDVLPAARRMGLGVIAREAFQKGALFRIGADAGVTDKSRLARAALRWVLDQDPDCVIIGADSPDQLRANARTLTESTTEDDLELLNLLREQAQFVEYQARRRARFFELPNP